MGMPDADETEIAAGARAIIYKYGDVIGENQARNIAWVVLTAARGAKYIELPAPLSKLDQARLDTY